MQLTKEKIAQANGNLNHHEADYNHLADKLGGSDVDVEAVGKSVADFQVAVPSWALGASGTRFGRFSFHGEPGTLEQKIDDVGFLHTLMQTAGAVSLHIPLGYPDRLRRRKATRRRPQHHLRRHQIQYFPGPARRETQLQARLAV